MKFKKSLSLLLSAVMVAGVATVAAYAAESDSEAVGYSNQSYLENYANSAKNVNDFGATYTPSATTWKTWSPDATSVKVKLYNTGSDNEAGAGAIGEYEMTKDSASGVWSLTKQGDFKNKYYTYLVSVKGAVNETQDVYSKATGVNGNRSMVVDLDSTDPEGWSDDHHVFQDNPTTSVVWEVHVRDFSISPTSGVSEENKGRYLAFTEGGTTLNGTPGGMSTCIDYLVEKGVNTVQLQPVYDFGSVNEAIASSSTNRNWGYDPVNYNVPEGSYSSNPYDGNVRITEFKQMVQALHDRGITVVMDVVYNHTYVSDGSCFSKTVPGYYYRMTSSSSYSNGSGCGNETASDKQMFRKYMVDSCAYWADEYHIDGFRFDLMALHDTTTLNDIRAKLDSTPNGTKILMYGEPWTGGTSQCPSPCTQSRATSLSERVGMFNDSYRDAIKGSTDGADGNFIQGSETDTGKVVSGIQGKSFAAKAPSQTVAYADAHDNLILWDKLAKSNSKGYESTDPELKKQTMGVMTLLMTSKGIPFMTAGSEMGRTKKGDANSYKSSDAINQIDWNRANVMPELAQWYKTLMAVRSNFTAIKSNSFNSINFASGMGHVVAYTYSNNVSGEWNKVCVLYNNGTSEYAIAGLSASDWKVVANSVAGSSISKTGADIKGIADFNGSSIKVPAKGSIVLINGFANKSVDDAYGTLVITHQTQSGTVLKTQNAKYRAGSTYRALPDATIMFARELVATQGASSGVMQANATNNVTFVYSDNAIKDGYLTVKYVDAAGKELKETAKTHYKEGDAYSVSASAIQGYELDTSKFPGGTVGTFDGNDKTITFVYKPLTLTSTKVHYLNSTGAKNVWMYAYAEDGSAIFGTWDAVLKNAQAKMTTESGQWLQGTIPAGSAYVIFRLSGGKQEPGQGESGYLVAGEAWIQNKQVTFTSTVKTSHINLATGEKVADDVIKTADKVTAATTYTTSALPGRTDVIVPGNATGTYSPGVVNVIYFYTDGAQPEPTTVEPPTEPSTVPPTEPTTEDPNGVLVGDVDMNGKVEIVDGTLIQKHLAEIALLSGDALNIAADCDGSGKVNIKDVTCLQKYLAEYTDEIGRVGKKV